ncbi:hypothetical protein IQ255_17960 [Pleurocapsales cyanobacterium LEGE 10410]|nr:hypothetical protein [Pleurocapsales cyanobacterium LEGE 10410]
MFAARKSVKAIQNGNLDYFNIIFIGSLLVPISELVYAIASFFFNKEALIAAFDDDAFYYFEVAQNIARGFGSTFDGINLTNGYHPLWMFFLIPIYNFFSDKYLALIIVRLVALLFWFLSVFILYKISKLLENKIVIIPSLIILSVFENLVLKGMETTILLPLILLLIYQTLKYEIFCHSFLKINSSWKLFHISLILLLIFFSRLDSIFIFFSYVSCFFIVHFENLNKSRKILSSIIKLALPLVTSALIYIFINQHFFDTFTPISGQAKSLGEKPFYNLGFVIQYFQGVGIKKVVFVLIALFITFIARKRLGKVIGQDKFKDLSCLCLIFIASLALQLSYYYLLSTYAVWHWYRYLMIPIQIIASIFISYYVISFGRVQRKLLSYVLCFLCLTYVVRYSFYGNIQQFMTISPNTGHMTSSVSMSDWINKNLPDNTVLAMGDRAGSLGYQLNEGKSLIQLEGLVNSKDYLDHLQSGTGNQFIQSQNVEYIVVSRAEESLQNLKNPNNYDVVYEPVTNFVPVPRISICLSRESVVHQIKHKSSVSNIDYDVYRVYRYDPEIDNNCQLSSRINQVSDPMYKFKSKA